MKKQYSIITSFVICMILFSLNAVAQNPVKNHQQQVIQKADISSQNQQLSKLKNTSTSSQAKDVNAIIWSDDFSVPANWTIANTVGNSDNWVISTTGPSGSYAIAPIMSTSASNGYALFDSDLMCSGNQVGNITTTNAINCTGHTLVGLKFQQYYRRWYDSTFVFVSNNGSTWTKFRVNTPLAVNAYSGANPTQTTINISSVAANQATVYIRFQFYSPSSLGVNGGCGYAWMVDDVSLEDLQTYDVTISKAVNPNEYVVKPLAHYTSSPLNLSATVNNVGANTITNVNMTVNVYNLSNLSLVHTTGSNTIASLASFASGTLTATSSYTPPVDTSIYYIEYIAQMTETDGDNSNDTLYRGFWISDSLFARSDEMYTGELDGALGFGAGTEGLLGSDFTLTVADKLSRIDAYVTGPIVGDQTQMFVYSTNANGVPTTQIGSTAIYTFTAAGGQWVSLPIQGGALSLAAGTYYVALKEFSATDNIGLAYTDDNYTPLKSFIKIGTAAFDTLDNYSYFCSFILEPYLVCASFKTAVSAPNTTICAGETATITAVNGATYSWSTGETTAVINVTPTTTTTYTVTATNQYGCTDTDNITITVNPVSATAVPVSSSICTPACTDITATGGGTYIWNTMETAATINVCPTTTTAYTVTVTAANGCTATATTSITVGTTPTANAGTDVSICAGSSTQLSASSGPTYAWSPATGLSATNIANPVASPTTTTTYVVTVSDNGCSATDDVTVTVNPTPVADAGTDQSIPSGTSTTLSGNASSGTPAYTYNWAPAGDLVAANVQNPTTNNLTTTTVFTLTVTDQSGCTGTDQVTITVTGGTLSVNCPTISGTACPGACAVIGATVSGGTPAYSYLWSAVPTDITLVGHETEASPTVCPDVTTTYTLLVTDNAAGTASCSFVLNVATPLASDTSTTPAICGNSDGTATVNVTGGVPPYVYIWSNSQMTQTATGLAAGTYYVTVTDANGCIIIDTAIVNCVVGISEVSINGNISIAPNPSDGLFDMTITGYKGKEATLYICNLIGQTLYSESISVTANNYSRRMNLQDFVQGIYMVKIVTDGTVRTVRLIIE